MSGIFRGLFVDRYFETSETGETVYYPYGIFGRGYVVPPDRIDSIKRGIGRLIMFAAVVVLVIMLIPFAIFGTDISTREYTTVLVVIVGILFTKILQDRLLRGLAPIMAQRPGLLERLRQQRTSRPLWTGYVELALAGSMLLGGSDLPLFAPKEPVDYLVAIVAAFIFAFLAWDGAMTLIEKRRASPQR